MKRANLHKTGIMGVLVAAAAGLLYGPAALAAGPAAIIEDVDAPGADVAFIDYV